MLLVDLVTELVRIDKREQGFTMPGLLGDLY